MRDGKCLVIRLNRNRCQYCRFRKCLSAGMSKDSVRYGRMPRRSRGSSELGRESNPNVANPNLEFHRSIRHHSSTIHSSSIPSVTHSEGSYRFTPAMSGNGLVVNGCGFGDPKSASTSDQVSSAFISSINSRPNPNANDGATDVLSNRFVLPTTQSLNVDQSNLFETIVTISQAYQTYSPYTEAKIKHMQCRPISLVSLENQIYLEFCTWNDVILFKN